MEITGFRHQTSRILPLRIDLYGNELWLFRPNDSNGHGNADWQGRDRGVEFRDGVYPLAVDRGDHIANVYISRFTWALPDRNHQYPLRRIQRYFLLGSHHTNLKSQPVLSRFWAGLPGRKPSILRIEFTDLDRQLY